MAVSFSAGMGKLAGVPGSTAGGTSAGVVLMVPARDAPCDRLLLPNLPRAVWTGLLRMILCDLVEMCRNLLNGRGATVADSIKMHCVEDVGHGRPCRR
jgi:hypothetical protein